LTQLLGARARGVRKAIVSGANAAEASLVEGLDVRVVTSVEELVKSLRRQADLPRAERSPELVFDVSMDDLGEVRGQAAARRALEIAAAGGHNLAMIGPPGAGKTMLARRLPALLPPLSTEEALEVTAVHSVAGLLS